MRRKLLEVPLPVWSVLYQRAIGSQFFPELFVLLCNVMTKKQNYQMFVTVIFRYYGIEDTNTTIVKSSIILILEK
jgi:hypothetical protein